MTAPASVRLLMVDDDPGVVAVVRIMLGRRNTRFVIDSASSVSAAATALGRNGYDVCLLDYHLGDEDGLDLLRTIPPRNSRAPIVLLTGDQDEALAVRAIEAGADDYLSKGELDPVRLERTLLRAIARHAVEADLYRREARVAEDEKLQAIGQLAGGVAHEFNNLLTAILGFADLLRDECPSDPAMLEDIAQIRTAAESAASLTGQLLALGRRQIVTPEVIDVNDTLERVGRLLRSALGAGIDLETVTPDAVGAVEIDPVRFQELLVNLANHARAVMPSGGRVRLTTRTTVVGGSDTVALPPGPYVVIALTDSGPPLEEAVRAHIFEPFAVRQASVPGSGLGLATVHGIAARAGGTVTCEPAVEGGTTFSIYLPQTTKPVPAPAPAASGPLNGSETILLVDDQEGVRHLARRILESHGYHVLEASDAQTALAVAASADLDLLLTDIVMPGMHGPELARTLAASRARLPVIYMSGYAEQATLDETAGARLVGKPFAPEALLGEIRRALGPVPGETAA